MCDCEEENHLTSGPLGGPGSGLQSDQGSSSQCKRKWPDLVFNLALVAIPSLILAAITVWSLHRFAGIQLLPEGSYSTISVLYLLVIVSTVGIVFFLLSALSVTKSGHLVEQPFLNMAPEQVNGDLN
ncbi:hypothetical protein HDE_07887 [Halotydeus destructor]|nr:hypothetical protein HDE_07887 [Halotydeus destructor]